MENGKEGTNADCLIDDAADEINKMTIIDAESKNDVVKATAEISEKINVEVGVSKIVDTAINASKQAEEKPPAELLKKIKEQVEYYFGNVNMQRDKFLIEQTKLDKGWIPMTVMLKFKMLANFSKNVDVILRALESSDLIEISKDRKKIRRSPNYPLPEYNEECRKAQEARTIYVTGFPLNLNIDELKAFFESYQPFERIMMRKYQDHQVFKFAGTAFVQFETLDGAKAFMNVKSIKYEDTELIRKWVYKRR
ncbi:la protein homolog [Formica exsecta]|uniref:la protein homolog n=1 Tax=Formica exsecta TaxID=72781 RepID=UPI001143669B|nr:la protein homolog [Formica exsecta]XP_029677533.1 la protein homolog [Formica exsecta]